MNLIANEIKEDIEILKKIILENIPTEQIWIFGSYAYGTPNKNSDIDVCVVMKDFSTMRELDAMVAVDVARYKIIHRPLDILVVKSEKFKKRKEIPTIERKIVREGIKIYG
ncbi:MAG: nucleotidyltransferase domain-containing protein [Chitinivibrionia bacterium]|nr:nucleotidyltransferase domain-containing protein [Chitinivibrionia bacterium]